MASNTPKIVFLKKDESSLAFSQEHGKHEDVIDAVEMMATDFIPKDSTFCNNEECGFFVKNLSESEVKKMEKDPRVVEIVDDIDVFAFEGEEIDYGLLEGSTEDTDFFSVEMDEEEGEEVEDLPLANLDPFSGIGVDPFDLEISNQTDDFEIIEPEEAISDFDENKFDDFVANELSSFPPKIKKILNCVLKCIFKEFGLSSDLSDEDISKIIQTEGLSPNPEYISAVRRVKVMWNIKLVNAPIIWRRRNYGKGVRVAVIDTGIGPNRLLRPRGGVSFVPGVSSWRDDHGHGTHVAGTIAGYPFRIRRLRKTLWYSVSPLCSLYAVKVLNKRGQGKLSWILNGLSWCLRHKIQVINLSLGSGATTSNPRIFNRAYERIGRRLRRAGAILIAAAGNSGRSRRGYHVGNPARCPSYLAVAAVDRYCRRANFSSYGPQVELSAPGVQILSLRPKRGFTTMSGTSMASPHVAGVAALVKSRHPSWSGDRVRARMDRTATDLGIPRRDKYYGFGLVNAGRAAR